MIRVSPLAFLLDALQTVEIWGTRIQGGTRMHFKKISFLEYFAILGGMPASPKIVPIMRHGVEPPPRPRRYDIRTYVQEQSRML